MNQPKNQSNTEDVAKVSLQALEEIQEKKAMDRTEYEDWVMTLASESDRCKSDYMSADVELQSLIYPNGTEIPDERFERVAKLSTRYMEAESALSNATPIKWEEWKLALQAQEVSVPCQAVLCLRC